MIYFNVLRNAQDANPVFVDLVRIFRIYFEKIGRASCRERVYAPV